MKVFGALELLREQAGADDAAVLAADQAAFSLCRKRHLSDTPQHDVIRAPKQNHGDDREQHPVSDFLEHDDLRTKERRQGVPGDRCSAIGPSTATGMNMSRPRIAMTAQSVMPNVALSARSEPAVSGAAGLAPSDAARATPAASVRSAVARSGATRARAGATTIDTYSPDIGGDSQGRPRRPRPAVWASAMMTAPS